MHAVSGDLVRLEVDQHFGAGWSKGGGSKVEDAKDSRVCGKGGISS